jgi:Predicted Fe-S oxidoreductases
MVVVEITNMCNLECVHCPYSVISKRNDYRPRHMSWEIYEKIVREVAGYDHVVFRLLCNGEPLMHPRFLDMLRFAKEHGIGTTNFITNGLLLTETVAREVLALGVEVVEISLDALEKRTYEIIRRGSHFETVMAQVHRFIALRDEMRARTKIMVSIIDQDPAKAEMDAFIRYWTPRADRVIKRVYATIGGLVDDGKTAIDCSGERWPCPQLWRRMFINVDGKAEFCVEDWHDETIVGDVASSGLQNVWRGAAYEQLRKQHLSGNFDEIPYCGKCRDWKARDWNYDYFYALNQVLTEKVPEK